MKLLNQSIRQLSIFILAIVTIWSIVFYMNMVNEIKNSIDEGLENYKRLIILNAQKDPSILNKKYFDESFLTIRKIDKQVALSIKDQYKDTVVYMQDNDDLFPEPEPVRMLITAFKFDDQYYELKVSNSMVEKEDMIHAVFLNIIWLYVILIIGILIINNVILKKLWKPFYDLLSQLKSYRLGITQEQPKITTKTREFKDLQRAVNILLQDNKDTFEQQKQFIGNASHELQTPLAIVGNKLELLLENTDLDHTQAKNLTEIYQILQRMVKLNKSLLLLSKIQNKQFIDSQQVSINEVVEKTLNELEDFALSKNIKINYSETENLSVVVNPELANIVVSNLIKNAIFHNFKDGLIEISISNRKLKVSNTGKTEALDSGKMFNRFYKSHSGVEGTGLGLAIVRAIIDLYGFSISYDFNESIHSIVIRFDSK